MPKTPFLGTAYTAKSPDLACQRLINLYLESAETKEGSAPGAFYSCPGLTLALALPTGPVRAFYPFGGNLFVIAGNTAYEVTAAFGYTALGALGTSSGPAYIGSTKAGNQVGFFDASGLWVWDGATYASVPLPFSGPVGTPAFQDTLCLVNEVGTYNIWQCDPNNLKRWQALNFTTEDGNDEPIIGLAALHDQITVFKAFSCCFYVNQGNTGFAYGRLPGVYPLIGAVDASTIVVLNDKLLWLGQSRKTAPRVYKMDGYEPLAVSTYAIDNSIQNYPTVADAFAFGYGQAGHTFYVISFPSGGETWAYDEKESVGLKMPVWHQRASFSQGQFGVYAGACAANFGGFAYLGDNGSGNIYLLDPSSLTDNGLARKWLRSWRARAEAGYTPERIDWLDIQCETGLGVPPGTNPQFVLRQSFDDGATWSNEIYAPAGPTGQTMQSIHFTRLGSTRRGLNSDRIFELSSTDPFPVAMMAAEIS